MPDLHLQNFVGDEAVHRERHPGRGAPMTQADRPHRDADAVAVMALERVPADIRAQGGVSRMSDPDMIDSIVEAGSGIFKSGNPAERAE
ncbi:MAG TPA: hypothetical protein VFG97_04160, partial [Pedococcus sp.]|nr:hypothetical protein [Pedococcus sp.]